jgi:cytochrome c-type biogenesis protein CcmH/NrfG
LGNAYLEADMLQDAKEAYEKALDLRPNYQKATAKLSLVLKRTQSNGGETYQDKQ